MKSRFASLFIGLLLCGPSTVRAQEHAAAKVDSAAPHVRQVLGPAEVILPHITDSKIVDLPCFKSWEDWNCEWHLPTWNVTIGSRVIDMGPTKHVFFLALSGALCILMLFLLARAHARQSEAIGRPKGRVAFMEGLLLVLRNEMYMPVLGKGGAKFIPFTLTLFFFILFCNLMGLFPWGSTPTGNVSVTATLALITFITVEITGMRTLGKGYIGTIVYWPHDDMSLGLKIPLSIILTPIEILGKFTKPFALTIRLFANMLAGHVIILALFALILSFGVYALPGLLMALGIMFLEILVAGIQAFIFSLLAAVFIGQIRTAHH